MDVVPVFAIVCCCYYYLCLDMWESSSFLNFSCIPQDNALLSVLSIASHEGAPHQTDCRTLVAVTMQTQNTHTHTRASFLSFSSMLHLMFSFFLSIIKTVSLPVFVGSGGFGACWLRSPGFQGRTTYLRISLLLFFLLLLLPTRT